jgi:hypothetical protein
MGNRPKSHVIHCLPVKGASAGYTGGKSFMVGRFRCTIAMHGYEIIAHWHPYLPYRKQFNRAMYRQYLDGRDGFMDEVAEATDADIFMLEQAPPPEWA